MPWVDDGNGGLRYVEEMTAADESRAQLTGIGVENTSAGQQSQERPAQPDGWPGWRWDGSNWSDAHNPQDHQIWLTNNAGPVDHGVPTQEEIGAPVVAANEERGEQTQDLVNRYSAVQIDNTQSQRAREMQDKALGMQEQVYQKLLAYDPAADAEAASKRAQSRALAMARSAPGGAGARQAAMFQALQQTPAIQSEAAEGAAATQARNTQLAAQAAAGFAQTAQGQRGQDLDQAQADASLGLNIANGIANAVGRDIQLTSDEAQFLGKMQTALAGLDIDWARLDEASRAARVEEELRKRGLHDQWEQFKQSQKVTGLDVLSAITGTARAGVETYGSGKQAGLW